MLYFLPWWTGFIFLGALALAAGLPALYALVGGLWNWVRGKRA